MTGLILASASLRRQHLLASAGINYDVIVADIPEHPQPGEHAESFAERMAREKAKRVHTDRLAVGDRRPILAADTIVVLDRRILGKPRDRDDAQQMLKALSGRTHTVVTATCLLHDDHAVTETVRTEVSFRELSAAEIERYLDRACWHDKAGAYAVQQDAAYMVRRIEGSYTNVVGLPLCETVDLLRRCGVLPTDAMVDLANISR